jgi:hypothetical protein
MRKTLLIFLVLGMAIIGTSGAFPDNMILGKGPVITDFGAVFESPYFYENSMTGYIGFDFDNWMPNLIQKFNSEEAIQ